jgi:hypothetical protein
LRRTGGEFLPETYSFGRPKELFHLLFWHKFASGTRPPWKEKIKLSDKPEEFTLRFGGQDDMSVKCHAELVSASHRDPEINSG